VRLSHGIHAINGFPGLSTVPMEDILTRQGDDLEISFEYTTPFTIDAAATADQSTGKEDSPKQEKGENPETASADESSDKTTSKATKQDPVFSDVGQLFEGDFLKLYKTFHQYTHSRSLQLSSAKEKEQTPLEIVLKIKPVDVEMHKIFCFPFLSREAVREDQKWKKDYITMYESSFRKGENPGFRTFAKHFWALTDRMMDERGKLQTTVMADVMVECIETFLVKDVANNEILQGDGMERTVRHLLRMEMDCTLVTEDDQEYWLKGCWRIADIDDQLGDRGLWAFM
jgi:hypothetical protein